VWPRSSRLPNIANVVHPPSVRVRVGPPVGGLSYEDARADSELIMEAIVGLLPAEARRRHTPTEEEVARMVPPS
jgi:putative phosphoserine phosphatase/1-acylglycerol-3-phosphate O-acyltransferase